MGRLLSAFAYASDLAFGLQLEESMRSCYLAFRIAERMGLSDEECRAAYYTALLKGAGYTFWTTELAGAWQADEIVARREPRYLQRSQRQQGVPRLDATLRRAGPGRCSEALSLRQRLDDQSKHVRRGLRNHASTNISLGARTIAVADRLDELTHDAPDKPALSITEALEALSKESLDAGVIAALRRRWARVRKPPLRRCQGPRR
jgi:hypothetical protein